MSWHWQFQCVVAVVFMSSTPLLPAGLPMVIRKVEVPLGALMDGFVPNPLEIDGAVDVAATVA